MIGLLQWASRLSSGGKVATNQDQSFRVGRARAATPLPSFTGSSNDSHVCPDSGVAGSYISRAIQTGESDLSLPSLSDTEGQNAEPFETLEAFGRSQKQIPPATRRKKALSETPRAIGSESATRTVGLAIFPKNDREWSGQTRYSRRHISESKSGLVCLCQVPWALRKSPIVFIAKFVFSAEIFPSMEKGEAEDKRHYSFREHFYKDQKWS